MSTNSTVTVTSSEQTQPDGVAGYRKSIAGFVALLLTTALPWIVDETWAKYAALAIALLGVIAVYQFPNAVKPLQVAVPPTPTANLDLDDEPGKHAAQ